MKQEEHALIFRCVSLCTTVTKPWLVNAIDLIWRSLTGNENKTLNCHFYSYFSVHYRALKLASHCLVFFLFSSYHKSFFFMPSLCTFPLFFNNKPFLPLIINNQKFPSFSRLLSVFLAFLKQNELNMKDPLLKSSYFGLFFSNVFPIQSEKIKYILQQTSHQIKEPTSSQKRVRKLNS